MQKSQDVVGRAPRGRVSGGVISMRRYLMAALLGLSLSTTVGCFIPIYSPDPSRRTQQLLYTSENLRLFMEEWERIWFLDQPDHMTPFRTHGGVI
jgi:hypothetical protein